MTSRRKQDKLCRFSKCTALAGVRSYRAPAPILAGPAHGVHGGASWHGARRAADTINADVARNDRVTAPDHGGVGVVDLRAKF